MAGKHDQIAGSLIRDILSSRYEVQDRLPSERDLAVRFDANRGAVREAMKKLEQIGLIDVKPGGARVKERSEASLDVIGYMLAQGDLPDPVLVDQILVVVNHLMSIAAEQTVELASDTEISAIRVLARRLFEQKLDEEAHTSAHFELMRSIMQASKNLPLQLISRGLFEQFAPSIAPLNQFARRDPQASADFARQLDTALQDRDVAALRTAFAEFSKLHRQNIMRAFERVRQNAGQEAVSI